MNGGRTLFLLMILSGNFIPEVHDEVIPCWECSSQLDEDCGKYDRVGDHQILTLTKNCSPVGSLTRACYRAVILHEQKRGFESELRLFCGPAMAHDTVCKMISFFLGKIGVSSMRLTHCSICSLPLCNSTPRIPGGLVYPLIFAWMTKFGNIVRLRRFCAMFFIT